MSNNIRRAIVMELWDIRRQLRKAALALWQLHGEYAAQGDEWMAEQTECQAEQIGSIICGLCDRAEAIADGQKPPSLAEFLLND